jgi:hypothetical protein
MRVVQKNIFACGYGIILFIVAMIIAWLVMFRFDFLYGVWHDHAGIKEGIEKFGPLNRYKPGFGDTTRAQRLDAFHQIVVAVHSGGRGLEDIRYQSPTSGGEQRLLREAEIVHLRDVASLIDFLMRVAAVVLMLWPAMAFFYFRQEGRLPRLGFQLVGLACLLGSFGLALLVFGAENVFNQLHIWVFPAEHQWYFFYQDSLMSTMMLAPRLFGWIAATWLLLAIAIHMLLHFLTTAGVERLASKAGRSG